MPSLIPLVALMLTAAPPRPSGVASRRVNTPEGTSFTVPAGFSYEGRTQGSDRVHVMKGTSGFVTVTALVNELEGGCDATFTTTQGLEGCAGEQHVEAGSGAFAVVRAGRARVIVIAITADATAGRLARAVAESVRVTRALASGGTDEVTVAHRPDERFFGCFSTGSSFRSVSSAFSICLREDLSFEWRSSVRAASRDAVTRQETAAAYGDGREHGTWWAEPVSGQDGPRRWVLRLRFEDGREASWNVRFYSGDLVKGENDLWTRTGG